MTRTRVAIMWISLGPYHWARLNALAEMRELDVRCFELARREALRGWEDQAQWRNAARETLYDGRWEESDKRLLAQNMVTAMARFQPDVIVSAGYAELPMRQAVRWGRKHRRLSILMADSQWIDRPRLVLKEYFKGWWLRRHFDAAFVAGERHVSYLSKLGFPGQCVWKGYNVVDNRHFDGVASEVRRRPEKWRTRWNLPLRYFLYVGRLAREKNLSRLLNAYSAYRAGAGENAWDLVLVGAGPCEEELRTLARQRSWIGVHFAGAKTIEELPAFYALASCFVLPSVSEPWGLVVNEAMACGLPVLVSQKCGAAGDLVLPGVNGYVFDPLDVESMRHLLARLASDRVDRDAMGNASRQIIGRFTPENWARTLADCIAVTRYRRARIS